MLEHGLGKFLCAGVDYEYMVCRRPEERLLELHAAARFIGRVWRRSRITLHTLQSVTSRIPSGLPVDAETSPDAAADGHHQEEELHEAHA